MYNVINNNLQSHLDIDLHGVFFLYRIFYTIRMLLFIFTKTNTF